MTDQPVTDEHLAHDDAADASHPARPRRRATGLLVAPLCALLGFALVTSAHTNRSPTGLSAARQDDLVRILDGLTGQADRLRQQVDGLTADAGRLRTGQGAQQAAVTEAQRQADALAILAGTVAAHGPGVVLTVTDPRGALRSDTLLDAVEELRDAGAEAIQVDGVRVVASTAFTDVTSGGRPAVAAGGTTLTVPYTIRAIGDGHTLEEAMRIPGGVVDTVAQAGGDVQIAVPPSVSVTALRVPTPDRYARPVPGSAAPTGG